MQGGNREAIPDRHRTEERECTEEHPPSVPGVHRPPVPLVLPVCPYRDARTVVPRPRSAPAVPRRPDAVMSQGAVPISADRPAEEHRCAEPPNRRGPRRPPERAPPVTAGATARPGPQDPPDQHTAQYRYHRDLFPALHDWENTRRAIVGFTGQDSPEGLLGLDQMGHFGPQGCDLVADTVAAALRGPRPDPDGAPEGGAGGAAAATVDLCELGSGFGGSLRHTVDRLTARGVAVRRAHGVDLVAEHCAVSRRISGSQGRGNVTEICADATAVPLPDTSLDVVTVTGSMPHFPEPGAVLREAARLLRPGGLLVLTEEVSLSPGAGAPSPAFRATHPEGVFFVTRLADRLRQLDRAGLTDVVRRDLTAWAPALLAERLKVVRIFRGSVAAIYGTASADRIRDTLTAARQEYLAGRLLPALITARRR